MYKTSWKLFVHKLQVSLNQETVSIIKLFTASKFPRCSRFKKLLSFSVVLSEWESVWSFERLRGWIFDCLRLIILHWRFNVCRFMSAKSSVASWSKRWGSCRLCFCCFHFWLFVLLLFLNRLLGNCFDKSKKAKENHKSDRIRMNKLNVSRPNIASLINASKSNNARGLIAELLLSWWRFEWFSGNFDRQLHQFKVKSITSLSLPKKRISLPPIEIHQLQPKS